MSPVIFSAAALLSSLDQGLFRIVVQAPPERHEVGSRFVPVCQMSKSRLALRIVQFLDNRDTLAQTDNAGTKHRTLENDNALTDSLVQSHMKQAFTPPPCS